jgi:hypothetical protein
MFYDEEEYFILNSKKDGKVVVQGSVYFIETTSKKGRFCLSAHLYNGIKGKTPPPKKGCTETPISTFSFDELEVNRQYVPFKYLACDAPEVAEDWQDVIDDFSKRDYLSQHLS